MHTLHLSAWRLAAAAGLVLALALTLRFAMLAVVHLGARRLFDERGRLRLDRLTAS